VEKERKLQIIRAAIKRFQKHGLKKTTLEEVARDLRIGKATIYHYFNSKEELYFECLKFETSLFLTELKLIFENTEFDSSKKFTEYFLLKESLKEKYKLLFVVFIEELKGTIFDDEKQLINNFIADEKEIIHSYFKSVNPELPEEEINGLINFSITHSLSLVFATQISNNLQNEHAVSNSVYLTRAIEALLKIN